MVLTADVSNATKLYRKRNESFKLPDELNARFVKEWDLKYGENPHQGGAIYRLDSLGEYNTGIIAGITNVLSVRSDSRGKGGLSLTNMMDICRGIDVLKYFADGQAVVIKKHVTVSSFAKENKERGITLQKQLFRLARDADLRSNFGGTAAFSRPLDKETAEAMYELRGESPFFVDVIAAPDYEEGVLGYIECQSKDVRIAQFDNLDKLPKFIGDDTHGLLSIKELGQARFGIQELPLTGIKSVEDLVLLPYVIDKKGGKHSIVTAPDSKHYSDMLIAHYLNCTGARSNGAVFVKDGVTVAMGSGQVERVGAFEQAIVKGMQKAMAREGIEYDPLMGIVGWEKLKDNPFVNSVASSDAFFPFADSIHTMARVGVAVIIQPYGSVRDAEVIDAANKHGIAMPATLERSFGHW